MEFSRPGQNTGVSSLSLLQGIFPIQGSNPGLLHCRWILYQLSHKGSPSILEWVAYPFSSGLSPSRNWTGVSCIAGRFFTSWATREALPDICQEKLKNTTCKDLYINDYNTFIFGSQKMGKKSKHPTTRVNIHTSKLAYLTVYFLLRERMNYCAHKMDKTQTNIHWK